ncbi:hypothetical protein ACQJBY_024021 [Aegilops geniculata]
MEESDLEFVLDLVDRFPLREEFADNLEHPDPVLLRLLPRGRLALLARRIQMVNLVNREAPRWTKRLDVERFFEFHIRGALPRTRLHIRSPWIKCFDKPVNNFLRKRYCLQHGDQFCVN